MKPGRTVLLHLLRLRSILRRLGRKAKKPGDEAPLRAELFSTEQMEQHGATLARRHVLGAERERDPLLGRLAENEGLLARVCELLTDAIRTDRQITPAGEWLLDNFYLIEEQIRTARRHLPKGYSWELPRLGSGPSKGLPRVYDIALETISHGDGRVDLENLARFIGAYQTVNPLTLGELWAIPIMLKLASIENLRRVGARIAADRIDRNVADAWADQMTATAERNPKNLILTVADMARSHPPMTSSFVAELARRLQGQSPALALPLTWVEQQLAESGLTIEQLVHAENQQQAADQVSISNSIGSLRFLGVTDWRDFVEAASTVESVLREDPAGAYANMDFATRDNYRHVVERIAKRSPLSEAEVARAALQLAQAAAAAAPGIEERAAHVGYYLVDQGLPALEHAAQMRPLPAAALRRTIDRAPESIYLGAIALLTVLCAGPLIANAHGNGLRGIALFACAAVVTLATSQLAVALVNWVATLLVLPRPLPRMDFSKGIPPNARTLVVVPTLLVTLDDIEALVEALEVRFLANRDPHLHFALLTDFADADAESMPGDASLLDLASQRIGELNAGYAPPEHDVFFLLHRPRRWNASERVWMGYERKRGKLGDLNALLREGTMPEAADAQGRASGFALPAVAAGGRMPEAAERFSRIAGRTAVLAEVRYVITLDTDTQLPRDCARQLVGTLAHPLNRAEFADAQGCASGSALPAVAAEGRTPEAADAQGCASGSALPAVAAGGRMPEAAADAGRVTRGYGILQPRVAASLPATNCSRYAQLNGGEAGIDPYTRAVSDLYQDLFSEGSFIGKGIYDVDAFKRALGGRFPDNRILSHDLLEGCYARSGLLSDTQLQEDFPPHYDADVKRRHRWIRGDWQIAGWLRARVPGADGRRERNPLTLLSQWKIFDNLRRSLVPAALLLLLLLGWTVLTPAWLWTAAVFGVLLLPPASAVLLGYLRKPRDALLSQHLVAATRAAGRHFAHAGFALATLPYEAWFSLDAIVRTVVRMNFTRTRLLEWTTSSETGRTVDTGLAATFASMWVAPAASIATALALSFARPGVLAPAAPILLSWLLSPLLVWWLGRPILRRAPRLSAEQMEFLRQVSRRTWHFFDVFVGPDDHGLPPDNFQEHPVPHIAHRTSPTNMGLALLANLAACDFGYASPGKVLTRTDNAFATMGRMERYRGHFYNWYDTRTLEPLPPHYVSTVDSGNLLGHLLTLRVGLRELADRPILPERWLEGLVDTLDLVVRELPGPASPALLALQTEIDATATRTPAPLSDALAVLDACATHATALATALDETAPVEGCRWAQALARQCVDLRDDLLFLMPCLATTSLPLELRAALDAVGMPTLRELTLLEARLMPEVERGMKSADAQGRASGSALPAVAAEGRMPGAADAQGCASGAEGRMPGAADAAERAGLEAFAAQLREGGARARARLATIEELAVQAEAMSHVAFDFLYDETRHLLAIGYNANERQLDASYYDLLASETRLCNFVAIAQGQLPQESWFALGRLLTKPSGDPILLSWSGSMFEYLMPLLVMPSFEGTLLDQSCRAAVARQIEYGNSRGVPWGMSESGYNIVDAAHNYQYRAFGVPGLGLKRGLAEDLVVAPYATALALMVAPEEACANLQRLAVDGHLATFGFYEAIDYTAARLRPGQTRAVVHSFMAHHQGMSLLALAHLLLDRPMQRRFASDPVFQATMLLLHERIPRAKASYANNPELVDLRPSSDPPQMPVRLFNRPDTAAPAVQLLSNGRYHVMLTNAGGGYSRWKDIAVTRWREDGTCDDWGTFCYLRDVASGAVWSTAFQPTRKPTQAYEAIFTEPRVEFRRRDPDFDTHTDIVVSPEDDIELRRVRVTNRSRTSRTLEITSYAEVVLAPALTDALHPAFSNLFVQTEILPARQAILCTRRPRSHGERAPWMFHLLAVHGAEVEAVSFETDRARFIGRGRTAADPQAMHETTLSGTQGSVLDPIVAIRHRVTLAPEATVTLDLVIGMGESRDAVSHLVEKYHDRRLADRVFEMAWTHSQVVLRQINVTEAYAQVYGRLAGSILYANAALRADAGVIAKNHRGQPGLWGYAISGDLPIVLVQISDGANIELVRQLVQAHAYWRLKGLAVDLVVWNEDRGGYRQVLNDQIMGMIAAGIEASTIDHPGGIFVRPADQISNEDRILLQSVARIILTDGQGALAEQIKRRHPVETAIPRLVPTHVRAPGPLTEAAPRELILANGLGGFSPDGREYVITLAADRATPAPWVNVLANPSFGCVISEQGRGYTWSENAHEFRLTPWHDDPVTDASGEAFYLRDEETGHYWSPSALPRRGEGTYVTRHGHGYSVFEHTEDGIASELWVYVALDAAIRFSVLKVRNESDAPRRLSATGYVEWVLGDLRQKSSMHVISHIDPNSGALFARNPYNPEFAEQVAFFDVDDAHRTISADRTEFIGRNGTLRDPAALGRTRLSGRVGAAMDPCAAIHVPFELDEGQSREIIFRLGVAHGPEEASRLVQRFRKSGTARAALQAVRQYWTQTLGAIQIETPDRSLDVLANGWLLYQTIACRIWARSGYYQSAGAFGFRDQLQDVMALIHTDPPRVRAHLLRCASRQFVEGDVQHWWHPPSGRGVRTRCSDDFLWLPLASCRYVSTTGDDDVLGEPVGFLDGRAVAEGEDSYYDLPLRSGEVATLYQHCVRAIERGLAVGAHGLPLIGSGDWNDGMDKVGIEGRGESVWLGFFLYQVLTQFGALARRRDDAPFADRCATKAAALRENLERHGWDGAWYRRAYFDDGTPLGSSSNTECQIDSIAQSWSVLSGAGDPAHTRTAMDSLHQRLVRRDAKVIQLLDPPFDKSELDPGYIRGYVPGVRENGGQYTHGAIWAAMAFADLGDAARAWELTNMINPVNHAATAEGVATYKVEPYVVAADVYGVAPHVGRGGWTWYTGSAGWLYRLIVESLLGLRLERGTLHFAPCLPADWDGYTVRYRYRDTMYRIVVRAAASVIGEVGARVSVDGVEKDEAVLVLVDDGAEHVVEVSVAVRGA